MLGPAGYMVVTHRTLLSAPVPIRIGIWGLGLGLDNIIGICLLEAMARQDSMADVAAWAAQL